MKSRRVEPERGGRVDRRPAVQSGPGAVRPRPHAPAPHLLRGFVRRNGRAVIGRRSQMRGAAAAMATPAPPPRAEAERRAGRSADAPRWTTAPLRAATAARSSTAAVRGGKDPGR